MVKPPIRKVIPLVAVVAKPHVVHKSPNDMNEDRIKEIRRRLGMNEDIGYEHESLVTVARYRDKVKNPITAIRAKCVDCCCGSLKEVAECGVTGCPLHPFRMGVNPFNKKTQARLAGETMANPFAKDDDDEDDTSADSATE